MNRLFVLFSFLSLISTQLQASDRRNLNRTIEAINAYLQTDVGRSCPGVDLVVSCGNGLCELDKFENEQSCPADCKPNVTVRSYNSIILCDEYHATHIPTNIEEVRDIVKMALAKNLTVKPIGASHSATDIMCAEGIVLPMEKMDRVLGIGQVNGVDVVETETGITVFELSEWLHEKGLALAGLPHMGFRDVTVGGAIATGSHGSSTKHHGVISNIIAAIEFVDGEGEIQYLEEHTADPDEFKALSASLGLLGIVTKVKLKVQKQFNLAVKVSYHDEYKMFEQGVIGQVEDCDYGQLNWFPGIGKFVKTCGKKTWRPAHREANNELLKPKFPKFIVNPFKKVLQRGACNNTIMCMVEKARYWQFKLQPPLVRKTWGKKRNRRNVVGPSHRMVSSHLTNDQEGFFQMDWEIAVPARRAQDALVAIKKHIEANDTCLPLVGVFIRFAPSEDKTLLAHTTSDGSDWREGEPAVFFEMPVYLPLGFSQQQFEQYERQFVEFAQILIEDFSGRPHWGKNRAWTFDLAVKENSYGANLERFKAVMNKYDPKGVFSNKFSKHLWPEP